MIASILPINFMATLIMNSVDKNWFCHANKTFGSAVAISSDYIARLCTKGEVELPTMDENLIRS